MNRRILGGLVAVILLAVLLIMPGLLANRIQEETTNQFQNLYQTSSSQNLDFQYEKGWFSSRLEVVFPIPQGYAEIIGEEVGTPLTYSFRIKHGPVTFDGITPVFGWALVKGKNSFFPPVKKGKGDILNQIPPFEANLVFKYNGDTSGIFHMPAFEMETGPTVAENEATSGEQTTIKFGEIRVPVEFGPEDGLFHLVVRPTGFSFAIFNQLGSKTELRFRDITLDVFYNPDIPYPLNYERGSFSLAALNFSSGGVIGGEGISFRLQNIKNRDIVYRKEDNPLLDYKAKFSVGSGGVFQNTEGSMQVTSLTGSSEVLNLHGDALLTLFDYVQGPEFGGQDPEIPHEVRRSIELILASRLQYNIPVLSVETIWGAFDYNHRLEFPAIPVDPQFDAAEFIQNLDYAGTFAFTDEFVMSMIDLLLERQLAGMGQSVDEETREQFRQSTLQQFLNAGYLAPQPGGGYLSTIEFKNGTLTVNGQILENIGQLFGTV